MCPDFGEHLFLMRLDVFTIRRVLGEEVIQTHSRVDHFPFNVRRWSSNRLSATGMFRRYQRVQFPDLSPATNRIAFRTGSNANRILSSVYQEEPGRSSFKF